MTIKIPLSARSLKIPVFTALSATIAPALHGRYGWVKLARMPTGRNMGLPEMMMNLPGKKS